MNSDGVNTATHNESTHQLRLSDFKSEIYWVIGSMFLFSLLALIYALLATPVYRAETTLLPVSESGSEVGVAMPGNLGGLAALAGFNVDRTGDLRVEALATVVSRAFLMDFINENKLMSVLYPKESESTATDESDTAHSLNDAYQRFVRQILAVSEDASTGLVTLTIEWQDPETAALWANELVERLNRVMRERAIQLARESIQFLERELERTNIVGVQLSINNLLEQQINKIMLANVREQYAFRVLDKAIAPDHDKPTFPKTGLLIVGGAIFGLLAAIGLLVLRSVVVVRGAR